MGVGTGGDDTLVGGLGNETFDGLAGQDTVSYATAGTGVLANLGAGIVAYVPRIMPLGDSITYGSPLAGSIGGYRGPLNNELAANNVAVDFVGSAAAGAFPDNQNEGHPGYTITNIDTYISGWLAASRPDVVLLIAGTNDTGTASTPAQTIIDRLSHLIDDIVANPNAPEQIFIAPIPPMVGQKAARVALAQAYDALIPGLIAQKHAAGVNVTYVDMGDLTTNDITPIDQPGGGLHPNAAGYYKMADDWYRALQTNLGTDNGTFSGVSARDHLVSIENLEGSAYRDVLTGDANPNLISGLGDDDILSGGGGADTLIGGLGNDTYLIDNTGVQVIEGSGAGTDTVKTALPAYTLGGNLENLTFTGAGDFSASGNALNNSIIGGGGNDTLDGAAGKDSLYGGAGDDRLIGGSGSDRMEGGPGNDTYVVDSTSDVVVETLSRADGGGIDTVESSQTFTLGANLENLRLTGTAGLIGTGNDDDNVITGNTGANSLNGGLGNDTLAGGLGSDTLTGGGGTDVFTASSPGEFNGDRITDFTAGDQIVLKQNLASAANVVLDTSGTNALLKIDGDNNGTFETVLTLQGTVSGHLVVGSGYGFSNNVFSLTNSNSTLSLAATDATHAEGNSGTTAFTFTVTRAGDLSAASTADWAVSGSGLNPADASDFGGALPTGQVSFAAGESSKLITVNVAGDTVVEPDEGFTLTLSNPSNGTTVTQATAAGTITNDDGVIIGTNGNDRLIGGPGADTIQGLGGDDAISGNQGADVIDCGDGADTVSAGDQNDFVRGGAGDDLLRGNNDNDTLVGGAGADTLTGGSGLDVFRFESLDGRVDTITDMSGNDKVELDLQGLGVTGRQVLFVNGMGATTAGVASLHYIASTGALYLDLNGGDASDAVQFATISNKYALSQGLFLLS